MQEQNQPIHAVLDDKKRAEILGLLTLGCSRRKAAQCIGCAPSTITRLIQRDPDFAAKAARAEQNIETLALANIRAACKQERHWRASAWILEHRNPDDFAARPPHLITSDQVNQLLARFTEVLLPELPPEQWQHVTTALDEFIQSTQREIHDSQPRSPLKKGTGSELVGANEARNGGGEVPVPLPDDPSSQQSSTETGTPVDAATQSTPTPHTAEPTAIAEPPHLPESVLEATERKLVLAGGPAARPTEANQHQPSGGMHWLAALPPVHATPLRRPV